MKKFIAVVLLVAVFATLGLTACGSKNDNTATTTAPQGTSGETKATVKTAKDGVLTMVTNAEFPPYEYYDGDKIVGIDAEVAQLIAEKLGLTLEIVDGDFNAVVPGVQSNKYDMGMAGMTESEKNCGNPHMGTIRAITAGCDVILGPNDAWNAPAGLAQAVRDGILDEEIVNKACLRVLKQKYALGLFSSEKREDVPKRDGWSVAREIAKKSVTLIRDRKNAVPIDFEGKKVMVMEPTHPANRLSFGLYSNMTLIKETLAKYVPQAQLALFAPDATDEQIAELAKQAKAADIVVFGTSFRSRSGQVGLMTERQLDALKAVHAANPNMIAVVSNPYVASQLPFVDEIVCCYSTSSVAVEAAVDVIIGKEKALGVLRETIPEEMHNEVEIVFHG